MFKAGIFDRPQNGSLSADARTEEHIQFSREAASNGSVLLKNEGNLLPLDLKKIKKIAVLGAAARDIPLTVGGGSGMVLGVPIVSPFMALANLIERTGIVLNYEGYNLERAKILAKSSDIVIFFGGTLS